MMEMNEQKRQLIEGLRKNLLSWEGFRPAVGRQGEPMGLGAIETAFPGGAFPKGAIHEFISPMPEHEAACEGFLGGLLAVLMKDNGVCVWIGTSRKVFPASLHAFGLEPDRIIFVEVSTEREVSWALEESLKCEGLAAVVAELEGTDLSQSRRLQLAVERSRVTGFILRTDGKKMGNTACMARWNISPIPSGSEEGLPGLGFPRWQVELLKVRNGRPGVWEVEWSADHFRAWKAERPQEFAKHLKTG